MVMVKIENKYYGNKKLELEWKVTIARVVGEQQFDNYLDLR